jgi:kynurenine formamidase
MLIDLSIEVTEFANKNVSKNGEMVPFGHLGTHFDVMNKEFPLEYIKRKGIIFDVSKISGRDIDLKDIDSSRIEKDMFIGFYSGFIENEGYGTVKYFSEHPQLSNNLIEELLIKKVSIIGVDFAGMRKGKEHTPKDQYCADHDVFVVENLCNLKKVLGEESYRFFDANVYPIKFSGLTGLPCRVVAEL